MEPGTDIPVRTVRHGRLTKKGCVCGGRIIDRNKKLSKAPAFMRDYMVKKRSSTDCIIEADAAKHWPLSKDLIHGIFDYIAIPPTEWTWKLKLKKLKWIRKNAEKMGDGDVKMPDTDQDLYDATSTDEEWEGKEGWKSPDLMEAELCICSCACNGAPLTTAPAIR